MPVHDEGNTLPIRPSGEILPHWEELPMTQQYAWFREEPIDAIDLS